MGEAVVVGVDVGSRDARAVALRPDGSVAGGASAGYPGAEQWPVGRADPRGWLAGVRDVLAALARDVPSAAAPAAVCFGGQSPTTVPSAGAAVTCRHPAGATGTPSEQHLAQLALLVDEAGGPVEPLQLYDWLAAAMGAQRCQSRWPGDPELPGFGDVVPTGSVLGTVGADEPLRPGTPVVAGAQDAYLACWGAGLDTVGRGVDPGGRTGGLAVAVPAGLRGERLYDFAGPTPGIDVVGGPVAAHGLLVEWLAGLLGRPVPQLLDLAATAPPGARGVMVLPYLEGERAPRWNRRLRGEVVGLSSDTGPAELARAALEATGYGLRHVADVLAGHGVRLDRLVVGGSPARSDTWCAVKAAVLGVPVEVPGSTDLASVGAALSAGAGAGWWPAPGAGGAGSWPRPTTRVIEPGDRDGYDDGYRRWVALGDAAVARIEKGPPCPTP